MAMALALEYMTEWLRSKNNWKPSECGVQPEAQPALDAGSFYIALDDGGVEVTGNDETDSLKETLNITIGIWRRPEHLNKSIRGNLSLNTDKYLIGSWTLHDFERKIVIHRRETGTVKLGFHRNYLFLSALNTRYNLPDPLYGADFKTPLLYKGRSKLESLALDGGTDIQAWYGMRLRFRGLDRTQKLSGETDAIG